MLFSSMPVSFFVILTLSLFSSAAPVHPFNAELIPQLSVSSKKNGIRFSNISLKGLTKETVILSRTGRMVNLDVCTTQEECAGTRFCTTTDNEENICPADADECRCFPTEDPTCTDTTDCDIGEICARVIDDSNILCISEFVVTENPLSFKPEGIEDSEGHVDPAPPSSSGGLTFDDCTSDDDCQGTRDCEESAQDSTSCPVEAEICRCYPTGAPTCVSTADCEDGEVCVKGTSSELIICVSEIYVTANPDLFSPVDPSPGVTTTTNPPTTTGSTVENDGIVFDNGVCIDAKALEHLDADEMVFLISAKARVLCDKNLSCATKGHIVIFEGKAMMMGSYCELVVNCTEQEMYVNSPRYSVARRVESKTEGLEYTAFAARYGTRAEEGVLSAAVHLGL